MEEKEQLRQRREEAERQNSAEMHHRLVAGYFAAGLLAAAMIAGIVAVVANSGGSSSDSDAAAAFGTHYSGLEARRVEAGVTTMANPNSETHIHPRLSVYVNDKPVTVPVNIGIDPARPPGDMAGLHTHDSAGTIHNEGMADARLGQFFEIWGVPFSESRLGLYEARGQNAVRMWVDGKPSQAFGDLRLADGQKIVVSFGDRDQPPPL
jgi:hypothetical protein